MRNFRRLSFVVASFVPCLFLLLSAMPTASADFCPEAQNPFFRYYFSGTQTNVSLDGLTGVEYDSAQQLLQAAQFNTISHYSESGVTCSAAGGIGAVRPVTAVECCCSTQGDSFVGTINYVSSSRCPAGYSLVISGGYYVCQRNNPNLQNCPGPIAPGQPAVPPPHKDPNSPDCDADVGNPCNASNGTKVQVEVDLEDGNATMAVRRHYNSQLDEDAGFGFGWTSPFHRRLAFGQTNTGTNVIRVQESNGRSELFTNSGTGQWTGDTDTRLSLVKTTTGYTLYRRNGSVEQYDTNGMLRNEADASGLITTYAYDSQLNLVSVAGPFGHTLTFSYNNGHISAISDASGRTISYLYDADNNLVRANYGDGAGKVYFYEYATFPHALTGIAHVDTFGNITRYSTYTYGGSSGKAVLTEHAGGMERYRLNYDSDTQTTVTDAAGTGTALTFARNLGVKTLLSKTNQTDGKSLTQMFDGNNNVTCRRDEEGRVTTYTFNATNQRTSMTEGLSGSCASPTPTSSTRTTNYQYLSSTLSLPTLVQGASVAPGQIKTTAIQYADAVHSALPTRITQAGFAPDGGAVSRSITLAYNATGQVATVNGPRTDVNDVTTFAYYNCTTGGACGQLQSISNPLGRVTTFDSYDANGRLLQQTDPNGVRTIYGYDPRGRVQTVTQTPPAGAGSARLTSYTYNAASNITSVTFPDGIVLLYTYDAAQKLRQVTDNLGNKVTYSYDLKGNRIQDYTYDSSNTLVKQIDLAYDLRNNLASSNVAGSVTQFLNDAVGNVTQVTDPKNNPPSHHQYDALSRLLQTTDALGGITAFDYDVNNRLTFAQSPALSGSSGNVAITRYQYDDLGNVLREESGDRGTLNYVYDAAGNVVSLTNANGYVFEYTYDALNRLTRVINPHDPDQIYTYETGCLNGNAFALGRLCRVVDASGTTEYGYDPFGNIVTERHTEAGVAYTTSYTYDAGNRVTSITYPNQRVVTYARDGIGRITSVTSTLAGQSKTLVSARTYRPDRLLLSQTYGNALSEVRQYNLKGQLTYQSLGTADTRVYSYDANGNLTQKQTLPAVGTYGYDPLDRLIDETRTGGVHNTFTYNGNGNRLTDVHGSYEYYWQSNAVSSTPFGAVNVNAEGTTTDDGTCSYSPLDSNLIGEAVCPSGTSTYVYNAFNQRTRKTTSNGTTVYHYDLQGRLIAETTVTGNLVRDYVYADDQPIAKIESGETVLYVHTDHLDTPRIGTDLNRNVVWRWEGNAFGDTAPTGSATLNLRFPGQYYDFETGLYYNINRYYDPRIGRYISSDPIGLRGGRNTYAYAGNNSLRYLDPTGEFVIVLPAIPELVGIVQTILIGAGATVILAGDSQHAPVLPTDLVGQNPQPSSGKRTNSDLPASDFPGTVDNLTGGVLGDDDDVPGGKICPNGVRIRPASGGNGPRIDIPANGPKPPETIHFPPNTPWPWK